MIASLALIVAIVSVTLLLLSLRGKSIERYYRRGERIRSIVTATLAVAIAWTFIRSGVVWQMAIAVLLIMFATVFVWVEQPQKEIV